MDYEIKKFEDLETLNFNLINGVPWAEELWQFMSQGFEKSFLNFCKYVMGLSNDSQTIDGWIQIYKTEFESCTCGLVDDIAQLNSKTVNVVEKLLLKLQDLCRQLRIEMPYVGDEKLSLFEEKDKLLKRINEFELLIQARQDELSKIYEKQMEICTSLGKSPKILQSSPLPTIEQIEELQKYIDKLESEKYEREEKFLDMKGDIVKLIEELKVKPRTDFEHEIISGEDSAFLVTDFNMKELEIFYNKLLSRKQEIKEEINEKWGKIERLWTVLEVDMAERSSFIDENQGQSIDILETLNKEIKRLEAIKRANIKVFIDKYRSELLEIWDKCHCENQKRDFSYFNADCYTEDLLELFEIEINRWKKYYEDNMTLIKLVEEYQKLWKKVSELDEKASGPNRFKNRGGKLLQEEKERNKLQKKIPQIEIQLYNYAEKYFERTGSPFLTWGQNIKEFIDKLHIDRETERKLKLSARKQQRDQTALTPAKSSIQLFPTSIVNKKTPEMSCKRKLLSTPRTEVKKKPRVEPKATVSENKKRTLKVVSSRVSLEKQMRSRRRSANKSRNKENSNNSAVSEYDKFEMEMTKRSNSYRSTLYQDILPLATTTNTRSTKRLPLTPKHVPTITVCQATPKQPRVDTPRSLRQPPLSVRTPKTPRSIGFSAAKGHMKLDF